MRLRRVERLGMVQSEYNVGAGGDPRRGSNASLSLIPCTLLHMSEGKGFGTGRKVVMMDDRHALYVIQWHNCSTFGGLYGGSDNLGKEQ